MLPLFELTPTNSHLFQAPLLPHKRLSTIALRTSTSINQIKLTYSTTSPQIIGHEGGTPNPRSCILLPNEYVVKVKHERFDNFYSAGAMLFVHSNFGRSWGWMPGGLSTGVASECVVFDVSMKQNVCILGFIIEKGVLGGVEEGIFQRDESVRFDDDDDHGLRRDSNIPWFCVGVLVGDDKKIDDDGDDYDNEEVGLTATAPTNGITFKHYYSKSSANAAYKAAGKLYSKSRSNTAVIYTDVRKLKLLYQKGSSSSIEILIKSAIEQSFLLPKADEDVSLFDTFMVLIKVLKEPGDVLNFSVVIGLLTVSAYLDIYAESFLGKVLTAFATSLSDDYNSSTISNSGWETTLYCNYKDCTNNPDQSIKQSLIFGLLAIHSVKNLLYVINVYIHQNQCDTKNSLMRTKAFEHLLELEQGYFDTRTMAEIRSSMNCEAISNLISWNVPYLITRCFKLIFSIYFMYTINLNMSLIAILSILIIKYGLLEPLAKHETNVHRIQRKLLIKNEQILDESLDMITSIKLFSREAFSGSNYRDAQVVYRLHLRSVVVLRCVREFGYEILLVFSFCCVLVYYLCMSNSEAEPNSANSESSGSVRSVRSVSSAELTAFFFIFRQFQNILTSIKLHYDLLIKEFPSIERFISLMHVTPTLLNGNTVLASTSSSGGGDRSGGSGAISFKDVDFFYSSRPGELALKGVTHEFKANSVTAIVGDSGSGKTTLSKLIMRLYDPTNGSIEIDGIDLRSVDLISLHERIAIVPQTPDLFNATIRDNISYGLVDVPMDRIIQASKMANCYDFVTKFSAGFDTFAGNRGTQLSVGQKQRISIARAILRDPSILILDESTSALDAVNEGIVQKAINSVMKGRTVIVIAHRLSTIQNANEIVVFKDGRIVECGVPKVLMEKKGHYYNLVKKQTGLN